MAVPRAEMLAGKGVGGGESGGSITMSFSQLRLNIGLLTGEAWFIRQYDLSL